MTEAEKSQDSVVWDLEARFHYSGPYDEKIDKDAEESIGRAKEFEQKYAGKVKENLYESLREYESLKQDLNSPNNYLYLSWVTQKNNEKLNTRRTHLETLIDEKAYGKHLTFYPLEISKLTDEEVDAEMKRTPELEKYKSYVKKLRLKQKYFLSTEVEKALSVRGAWSAETIVVDVYEKQLSSCKYKMKSVEKPLNSAEISKYLFSPNQDLRVDAAFAINRGTKEEKINIFAAAALNSVAGEWHIESKERSYSKLRSRRNVSNNVSDEIVDALLKAVKTRGVALTKKYMLLKKALLKKLSGIEKFYFVDRLAPLDFGEEKPKIPWEEAVEIVRKSFSNVSPSFTSNFERLLSEKRIHAKISDNKATGAFCHGGTPQHGSFVLLSYDETSEAVETLGHESGHAVHNFLAYHNGYLQYQRSITLAETASLSGEMAVFHELLSRAKDDKAKLSLIMRKLDGITSSVTRQVSFDRFEELLHTARVEGVIGESDFDKFWLQAMREFYGEEGEVFDDMSNSESTWAQVHHFMGSPFYVYAYAFADLVVGAMVAAKDNDSVDYQSALVSLLSAGNTKDLSDALYPFGLNPEDPEFWNAALDTSYGRLIEEAEELAARVGLVDAPGK